MPSVTFHTPPGWPICPPDWKPDARWMPNPGWTPAPADWVFYRGLYGEPVAVPTGAWDPVGHIRTAATTDGLSSSSGEWVSRIKPHDAELGPPSLTPQQAELSHWGARKPEDRSQSVLTVAAVVIVIAILLTLAAGAVFGSGTNGTSVDKQVPRMGDGRVYGGGVWTVPDFSGARFENVERWVKEELVPALPLVSLDPDAFDECGTQYAWMKAKVVEQDPAPGSKVPATRAEPVQLWLTLVCP